MSASLLTLREAESSIGRVRSMLRDSRQTLSADRVRVCECARARVEPRCETKRTDRCCALRRRRRWRLWRCPWTPARRPLGRGGSGRSRSRCRRTASAETCDETERNPKRGWGAHHSPHGEVRADALVAPVLQDVRERPYAGRDQLAGLHVAQVLQRGALRPAGDSDGAARGRGDARRGSCRSRPSPGRSAPSRRRRSL